MIGAKPLILGKLKENKGKHSIFRLDTHVP